MKNYLNQIISVFTFGFSISSVHQPLYRFLTDDIFIISKFNIIMLIISISTTLINEFFKSEKYITNTIIYIFNILSFIFLFLPITVLYDFYSIQKEFNIINIMLSILISILLIIIYNILDKNNI